MFCKILLYLAALAAVINIVDAGAVGCWRKALNCAPSKWIDPDTCIKQDAHCDIKNSKCCAYLRCRNYGYEETRGLLLFLPSIPIYGACRNY